MRWSMVTFAGLVIGGLLLCHGCGSGTHGAGGDTQAKYAWGTLKAQLDYPIETTYEAAREAVDELELTVSLDEQDDVAARILAHDAQNDAIAIKFEALPESRTKMTIKVGDWGDKNKSNVIFDQIVGNLGGSG